MRIPKRATSPRTGRMQCVSLRSILYDKELQHRMAEQAKVEAGKKKIEWG